MFLKKVVLNLTIIFDMAYWKNNPSSDKIIFHMEKMAIKYKW